jgi:hypothetical protein
MNSSFGVVMFGNVTLGVVCATLFLLPPIVCSLVQCDSGTEATGYHVPVCGIRGATTPPRFCLYGHIVAVLLIALAHHFVSASGTRNPNISPNKRALTN